MTTAAISKNATIARDAASGGTFFDTLSSEWLKLISLRSTQLTLGLGYALSVGSTIIACLALGSIKDTWSPDFNPTTNSMMGTVFAMIVFSVFGVTVASREYASGTIRVTLAATPNRSRVFFAKLAILAGTLLVVGLATTLSMFFAGQAVLGAYGMPTATLADDGVARMVLGLGIVMPGFPIMGMAFGILFRSTAAGATTILGLHWLPQIFGEFVPMWFREHVLSGLPSNGFDSITAGHIESRPAFSDPAIGAVIAATWLIALTAAAYIAFLRRDA